MKAVILAGGLGTRLSEETTIKPKPMVEIGGRPILWHIMKIYSAHGINDFIICLGYKGYVIKEYFANYFLHYVGRDLRPGNNAMEVHQQPRRALARHAGRHRRRHHDRRTPQARAPLRRGRGGLLLHLWRRRGRHRHRRARSPSTRSMASWPPSPPCSRPAASARSRSKDNASSSFQEKPRGDGSWINGGFFVLSPKVHRLHRGRQHDLGARPAGTAWPRRARSTPSPHGFWQPMDTLRDKHLLEDLWHSGKAPWKVWP